MIVVAGEALVDIVGGVPRPGGGPYNTARALARLGAPTRFLGRLSDDSFGTLLRDGLVADGVDLALTSFGAEPTTRALAELDAGGTARYRFEVGGTSAPNLAVAGELPPGARALHVGTLGLVLEPMATALVELAMRESGRRLLMVDPNVRPDLVADPSAYRRRLESVFARATIVKASAGDMAWLYPGHDLERAAAAVLALGAGMVVVTLGAEGALAVARGVRARAPAPRVKVVDTIGAGDAFGAGLLAWLYERDLLSPDLELSAGELEAALRFACRVASLACAVDTS
ncbi:MAG TPA: carbohydrate kinase [Candidatus Dormibacteraeota bacterium]